MADQPENEQGLSAGDLEKLVRREMRESSLVPEDAQAPAKKPLSPEVQKDLDALLDSIYSDLKVDKPKQ